MRDVAKLDEDLVNPRKIKAAASAYKTLRTKMQQAAQIQHQREASAAATEGVRRQREMQRMQQDVQSPPQMMDNVEGLQQSIDGFAFRGPAEAQAVW